MEVKRKLIGSMLTPCGSLCGVPQYTEDLAVYLNTITLQDINDLKQQKELGYVIFHCCLDTYHGRVTNPGLFENIAEICTKKNILLVVMLHSTPYFEKMDQQIKDFFHKLARYSKQIIVHSQLAKEQLNKLGIEKITIIPHGCHRYIGDENSCTIPNLPTDLLVASFGSMRHEKGALKILQATKKLKVKFMLLSRVNFQDPISMTEYKKILNEAEGADFQLYSESLTIEEILTRLKKAHIIVFAYPEQTLYVATGGAIRHAICTGVPVICTRAPRFSDLNKEVLKIDDSVEGIIEGIKKLVNNEDLRMHICKAARKFIAKNSWENIAAKYMKLLSSLNNLKS